MLSVAGLILIAFAILCVIPFDFSIKADCQIRPVAQVPIVSPVEGRIMELPVRAGELVYPKGTITPSGQPAKPLAVFDSTELVQQRAETAAKIGELNTQLADVSKKGDMVKIGGIQKQIDQAKAALDLVDHQISECTVWSPITGIVLTENVEQKRWSVAKKSEPLMEIASFSDWELIIDVPESEVATVRGALDKASRAAMVDGKPDHGIDIEYILTPWPERAYPVRAYGVSSLLPASMQSKSANVFRLEIPLKPADLPAGIALSGVTGRAKIHVGRKPLATQWTRGANRLLKMTIFF
jgi:hypothetical protein